MKDVKEIVSAIDAYLKRNGTETISPIEANEFLAKANILKDNKDRPGLPLRNLLRKGLIPHAYQLAGKGSRCFIPHSKSKKRYLTDEEMELPIGKKPTEAELEEWLNRPDGKGYSLEEARQRILDRNAKKYPRSK